MTPAEEQIYRAGFDAGRAHQKKAEPPPKAKQYRDECDDLIEALQEVNDQSLCAIGQDSWLEVQDRLLGLSDIATKAIAKVRR